MATLQHLEQLVKELREKFGLGAERQHEQIFSLKTPGPTGMDCFRLLFLEDSQNIALSFHIDLTPTDVIQLWNWTLKRLKEITLERNTETGEERWSTLVLLNAYYEGPDKAIYTGIDAQIMSEQEKQNRMIEALNQREDRKEQAKLEQAEWELEQAQKAGKKIVWH